MTRTVLFVHQNFPGQYRHLAPALLARGDRILYFPEGVPGRH